MNSYDVIASGIIHQFSDYYKLAEVSKHVIAYPDVFEKYLDSFPDFVFVRIYNIFKKNLKHRLSNKAWMSKFRAIISDVSYLEMVEFSGGSKVMDSPSTELYVDILNNLIEIGEISEDKMLNLSKEVISHSFKNKGYVGVYFLKFSDYAFEKDPKYAINLLHNTDFKKYPSDTRASLYASFVKAGLLDKKVTRRIRSDASERASLIGIKTLIEHSDKYDAKPLFLQLVDIKHSYCQQRLAHYAPDNVVPFLMGFTDQIAKKTIEKRLAKIVKKKEG